MTSTVPTPTDVYRSDRIYLDRYEAALKYVAERLASPAVVELLTMVNDVPTYKIEYNMVLLGTANPFSAQIDDTTADKIAQTFMNVGWSRVYWEELRAEFFNPYIAKGGYTFFFERPIDTVPYEVLLRIQPKQGVRQ